jgi:phosphocarrier protein HPr
MGSSENPPRADDEAASDADAPAVEAHGKAATRRPVTVTNALGLHLRAASKFVHVASAFGATVAVTLDDRQANGKSIIDLSTLAADCGSRLVIEALGPDAEAALDALVALVESGFQEDEPGRPVPGPGMEPPASA